MDALLEPQMLLIYLSFVENLSTRFSLGGIVVCFEELRVYLQVKCFKLIGARVMVSMIIIILIIVIVTMMIMIKIHVVIIVHYMVT